MVGECRTQSTCQFHDSATAMQAIVKLKFHLNSFSSRLSGSILLRHIDCCALNHLQHALLHTLA